jgi:hypothetical protein
MFTIEGEDEDHYADFKKTFTFLIERQEGREEFLSALEAFNGAVVETLRGGDPTCLSASKSRLEAAMSRVMARTERLGAGEDRNGMLEPRECVCDEPSPVDIGNFLALYRTVGDEAIGSSLEYWKSSAYPLSIMEGYKVKDRFLERLAEDGGHVAKKLRAGKSCLVPWERIRYYEPVEIPNPRLRSLLKETMDGGLDRLLWLPPAMPYYAPGEPFDSARSDANSKLLVFSAWRVAPKSIAMLLSYEAERRARAGWTRRDDFAYDELADKVKPLLKFAFTEERHSGLSTFCLLFPSATLAHAVDPLAFAAESPGALVPIMGCLERAEAVIEALLAPLKERFGVGPSRSDSWYWASLPLLDSVGGAGGEEAVDEFLCSLMAHLSDNEESDEDGEVEELGAIGKAIEMMVHALKDPSSLGPLPEDLARVLALVALGSPATCMLRSFSRNSDDLASAEERIAAWDVAEGFRSLFNQGESIFIIQRKGEASYWSACLEYGAAGNLQATLDELHHVLRDHLGISSVERAARAAQVGDYIATAVSLRSPSLSFESLTDSDGEPLRKHRIRCRFALRYGDERGDDGKALTRASEVRDAFNSPFRPFVLATTSVGQEGLDFHLYCRKVVHWNIPSNPVDLEQREGRVHRYKCLSVRLRIAADLRGDALRSCKGASVDPWDRLFALASERREPGETELFPFWIFPSSGNAIQRILWNYPMSRDIEAYEKLKKDCARYRAVLGQPRQQELLALLDRNTDSSVDPTIRIGLDLSPK